MIGVEVMSVTLALDLDLTSGLEDVDLGDPVGFISQPNANRSTAGGSRVEEIIGELEYGGRLRVVAEVGNSLGR